MTPHVERMVKEYRELKERVVKLGEFFPTTSFGNLVDDEQHMLHTQYGFMCDYLGVLSARLGLGTDRANPEVLDAVNAPATPTEPRAIKPEDIEGYITEEHYLNMGEVLGLPANHQTRVITQCVLVLKNGFTVTGESGCADPAKYNKEIGERIARSNAISKVWPLMGYVLRSQLAGMSGLID